MGRGGKTTIQQVAYDLLRESGKAMFSREIATIAYNNGLVTSSTPDWLMSLTQTLERNIRHNMGNKPRLVFIHTDEGRKIGLPEWVSGGQEEPGQPGNKKKDDSIQPIRINLSADVLKLVKMYQVLNDYSSVEDTIIHLIKKGLEVNADAMESFIGGFKNNG